MPEKILLIDDETKITRTLKVYLEQAGQWRQVIWDRSTHLNLQGSSLIKRALFLHSL